MAKAGAPRWPAHLLNPLDTQSPTALNPDTPSHHLVSVISAQGPISSDQAVSGSAVTPDEHEPTEPSPLALPRSPPARRVVGCRVNTRSPPARRVAGCRINTRSPAHRVAGCRVNTRFTPALRNPRPSDLPAPSSADPEPWSRTSRLTSHSSASSSGHTLSPAPKPCPQRTPDPALNPLLTVNSAAFGDNSQRLLTIITYVDGCKAILLVDSGASRYFLSTTCIKTHRLRTSPLPSTLRRHLADGTLNATATELPDALIQLFPEYKYETSMIVTHLWL